MRRTRLAESLLALVIPPDRASAVIGDLEEERADRGGRWFWTAVFRTGCSLLVRQVAAAPVALAGTAAVGWLVYMCCSLALVAAGIAASAAAWTLLYVVAHHTGVELLTDAMTIAVDWPPPWLDLAMAVQTLAMWAAGPYVTGRLVARHWKGREAALAVVLMTTWAVLAFAAPFVVTTGTYSLPGRPDLTVTTGTSASLLGAALMVAFVSWGTLRERLRPRRMTHGPAQPI